MTKKQHKIKMDKKELIVTIIVLIASLILGFLLGNSLFELLYPNS